MNSEQIKTAYKMLRKHERKEIFRREKELLMDEYTNAYEIFAAKCFAAGAAIGTVLGLIIRVAASKKH